MGIVGRGIILALPHIKNMETTRKQGHNLPSKRLIDRPKERKTPYVNRVGVINITQETRINTGFFRS